MSTHYEEITEEEMRAFLSPPSSKRAPDLWAWQGELVAVWLVERGRHGLAVKVYTSIQPGEGHGKERKLGRSAPSGSDAIRVAVVDGLKPSREFFGDRIEAPEPIPPEELNWANCQGVAAFPIIRRIPGWRDRLKETIKRAHNLALSRSRAGGLLDKARRMAAEELGAEAAGGRAA